MANLLLQENSYFSSAVNKGQPSEPKMQNAPVASLSDLVSLSQNAENTAGKVLL